MPTDTVKQLLARIKLDENDWNKQVQAIRDRIKDVQGQIKGFAAEQKQAQKEVTSAAKAHYDLVKEGARTERLESDELFARKKSQYDQELAKIKQQFLSKQIGEKEYAAAALAINTKLTNSETAMIKRRYEIEAELLTGIKNKAIVAEKEKQLEMRKSIELLRIESASSRRGTAMALPPLMPGEARGGPGFFGRIAGGYMQGGIGGAVTSIAGGVIAGELGLQMIEGVVRKFEELSDAIKQAGEEAGKEAQQEQTLRAIAGQRIPDMENFVLQMRDATRHLVDDSQIFTAATQAFRMNGRVTSAQITQLTNDAVKLGIAANGPAGATRALQAVQTYFTSGRSYALAYALGLSSTDRQTLMLGRSTTSLAQQMAQTKLVFDTVHSAASRIPEPLMTVSMAQEQYRVTLSHLEHEMAGVLQTSPGLVAIWRTLAETMEEKLKQFDENKKKFSEVIDGMTQAIAAFVSSIATLASYIIPIVAEFVSWIPRVQEAYHAIKGGITTGGGEALREQLAFVRGAPAGVGTEQGNRLRDMLQQAGLIKTFRAPTPEVEAGRQALIKSLQSQLNQVDKTVASEERLEAGAKGAADALEQSSARIGGVLKEISEKLQQYASRRREGETPFAAPPPPGAAPLSFQQQARIAEEEAKNAAERRENILTAHKEDLQAQLQEQQDALRKGEISEQDYASAVTAIRKQLYFTEIGLIEQKRQAEVNALRASGDDARLIAPKIEKANLDAVKGVQQAWAKFQLDQQKLWQQVAADSTSQARERADDEKEIRLAAIKDQEQANNDALKAGTVSDTVYFNQKRKLISDEAIAVIQAEQEKIAAGGLADKERVKLYQDMMKQLEALERNYSQTYFDEEEKRKALTDRMMQERLKLSERQVAEVQRPRTKPLSVFGETAVTQAVGPAEQRSEYQDALRNEINVIKSAIAIKQAEVASLAQGSDKRQKEQDELDTLNQRLDDTQQKLDATNSTTPAGVLIGAFQELGDTSLSLKTRFEDLVGGLQTFVQSVAGAIQGIESVRNSTTMLGGLQAGASVGGQLGSLAGPLGGAIGTVVGGILGAIQGAFNQGQIKIQQTIQENVNNITKWYQQGAITLTQAIADVEKEYETNLQRLSGEKYRQEKIALDNELAQLRVQQRQVLDSFEQNLDVLNVGPALQDTATQIEGIIQQWKDYVAAGGDVAKANQFLTESFQNLNQVSIQQLDQSYQDAIQNAINYNQLLYDRAALLDQTAQQERDILNQGVLVRQTTVAQTKAYQLQRLEQQTQQQLQTMDQEISVAKYKMDAESQIFNLAQTRIGLENQLTQVQEQLINYDMIRISALSNLVNEMKGGGVPMTTFIAQLLATMAQNVPGGPQLNTQTLQQLAAVLGVPLTPGGAVTTPSGPAYPGPAFGAGNPTTPAASIYGSGTNLLDQFNHYYNVNGRYGSYGAPSTNSATPTG